MTEYFLIATEFRAKAKRVYVAIENLMSRQSCLSLCRIKVNPPSRQKVLRHGVSMSRHSVLCRDSGARDCIAAKLHVCYRDTLSR